MLTCRSTETEHDISNRIQEDTLKWPYAEAGSTVLGNIVVIMSLEFVMEACVLLLCAMATSSLPKIKPGMGSNHKIVVTISSPISQIRVLKNTCVGRDKNKHKSKIQ